MDEELKKAYWLVGIEPGVSEQEAKAEFRKRALFFHPDRHPSNPKLRANAIEEMKKLNRAYDAVKEDIRKRLDGSDNSLTQNRVRPEKRERRKNREKLKKRGRRKNREKLKKRRRPARQSINRSEPSRQTRT